MTKVKFAYLTVLLTLLMLSDLGCQMSSQPEPAQAGDPPAQPAEIRLDGSTFYVLHYFNDELGRKAMDDVITLFQQQQPQVKVAGEPMDHETFKVAIPSLLESERPPDVFSYWAGARVQAVVDTAETFAFNYDLATPPPMAEAGLEAFSEFMARPNDYLTILQKTEDRRRTLF